MSKESKNIFERIKVFINKIFAKNEVKEIEESYTTKNKKQFIDSIKEENSKENLVVLKNKLSNKEITVDELDNESVQELIKLYKNSNSELKRKLSNI